MRGGGWQVPSSVGIPGGTRAKTHPPQGGGWVVSFYRVTINSGKRALLLSPF